MLNFIHQPESTVRLGDYLKSHLQESKWTNFRSAIAFVKQSGVKHISQALTEFSYNGAVKISVGIDHGGTSMEGLRTLFESIENRGEIWIYHNENFYTFHPKIYLFKNDNQADVLIGSSNLTEGGLFTNYEASFSVSLDLKVEAERNILQQIECVLDLWSNHIQGTAQLLTSEFLNQLVISGYVPTEAQVRTTQETQERRRISQQGSNLITMPPLFPRVQVPRAPVVPTEIFDESEDFSPEDIEIEMPEAVPPQGGNYRGFVMTLQKTDVGRGQTTPGKAARSPEIFIPLSARDYDPEFWGWTNDFREDPNKPGKWDRQGVRMRVGISTVDVNMMTWPDKSDFRLRSEVLRSAGNIGDILKIERTDGQGGFAYYVEIIPQGTSQYGQFLGVCVNPVRNSIKRWGYY